MFDLAGMPASTRNPEDAPAEGVGEFKAMIKVADVILIAPPECNYLPLKATSGLTRGKIPCDTNARVSE